MGREEQSRFIWKSGFKQTIYTAFVSFFGFNPRARTHGTRQQHN